MKISSSQIFCKEVDRIMTSFVEANLTVLRDSVTNTYDNLRRNSQQVNLNVHLKLDNYSEKEIMFTILLCKYLPEDLQAVYHIDLSEQIKRRVQKDRREIYYRFHFLTKGALLCLLMETSMTFKTTEEFFGYLLQRRRCPQLKFTKTWDTKFENNPVNHSRVRGYRDKGTLGSYKIDTEFIRDWSNRLAEEERRQQKKDMKDLALFIEGSVT